MPTFTDVHRTWLQTCASRSCMPHEEALRLFEPIWHAHHKRRSTEADLTAVHTDINERLRPMGQQIGVVRCDVQRKMFVVFADTGDAAIMKSQTNYSESERSLFHLLLKELATSEQDAAHYAIDQMTAINLTNQIKGPRSVSKQRAEELIAAWTGQGYLAAIDGRLHFGPRSVLEFGRFLQANYPEHVHNCPLCQVPVFRQIRCDGCAKPFHKDCLKKYLARNSKCPACKKPWNVRLSN